MTRDRLCIGIALGLLFFLQTVLSAQQVDQAVPNSGTLAVGSQVEVSGQESGKTDWIVSVLRLMKPTLSGRVTVPVPKDAMVTSAELTWQVNGAKVTGAVLAPGGVTLATFEGTATSATKVEGTFTKADGSTGPWSWEGTAAQ